MFVYSDPMKTLDQYMTENRISNQEAAAALNVTDQAVRMWRKFDRTPTGTKQREIIRWSQGLVTVFVDMDNTEAA